MKKLFIYIFLGILIITVSIFYIFKPVNSVGIFNRNFVNQNLKFIKAVDAKKGISSALFYKNYIYANRLTDIIRVDYSGFIKDTINYDQSNLIIGFDIDSTGVYLQDARKRQFSFIPHSGNLMIQKKVNEPLIRSIKLNKQQYLYKTSKASEQFKNEYLKVVDISTGKYAENDTVLPKTNDHGIATDGFFIKGPDGSVYHIYYYMSTILIFDSNGKYVRKFETLDGSNIPPESIETTTGHVPNTRTPVIHSAAAVDNQYLYTVSNVLSTRNDEALVHSNFIIDIYDIKLGKYSHSFVVPKKGRGRLNDFKLYKNNLIVTQGGILYIYKILT